MDSFWLDRTRRDPICKQGKRALRALLGPILLLCCLPSYATFIVIGTGEVLLDGSSGSSSWQAGEEVTLSFSYELTSFSDDLFPSNLQTGYYDAIAPLTLSVIGSDSGDITGIGPVYRMVGRDNPGSYDTLGFSNRVGGNSGGAFGKFNLSGTEFSSFPLEFELFHEAIFPVVNNETIWASDGSNVFITTGENLYVTGFQWSIAEIADVPVPATLQLLSFALVLLMLRARGPR